METKDYNKHVELCSLITRSVREDLKENGSKEKLHLDTEVASGTSYAPPAEIKPQPTYCVLLFTLKLNPTIRLFHSEETLVFRVILSFVHVTNEWAKWKYFSHMIADIYIIFKVKECHKIKHREVYTVPI